MLIGGLQKFSLLDYPEKISAIVFTQGCNYRCQFCYNPMLVWPIKVGKSKYAQATEQQRVHPKIKEDDLFVFLRSRAGKLDAVVITGGEPCLQKDLLEFIKKIKKLGFLVKLDTNGSYPETLVRLIKEKLVDYFAMDLKAPADKYEEITGTKADFNNIKKSVKIIMQSGLPYEFRTTVAPGLLNKDDISEMGKIIKGAAKWYLQKFKSDIDLVECGLEKRVPYNSRQMQEMAEAGREYVKTCEVR
ncbi:anaerobic ribonucleoside-triphosphate reductase activating protein [Candidatus Falkowbacteria bacterium]|nr:anaerobic ribonucleoside-triphosphate reductase activating protein [Candidatus Falkowbacteria bacterium]